MVIRRKPFVLIGGVATRLINVNYFRRISALYYTRSYHFIWKYASTDDLVKVIKAILGGVVLLAVINYFQRLALMMAPEMVGEIELSPRVELYE